MTARGRRQHDIGKVAGLLALLSLAACELTEPPAAPTATPTATPPSRPETLALPAPSTPDTMLSEENRALASYYGRMERDFLARGMLRTDGGGPDTGFTDRILARNFVQIALFDEYTRTPQGLRAQATPSRLRRWEKPVRFSVEFGATIPDDQRTTDRRNVTNFVSRLSRVTGRPMSVTDMNPNFHVLILNEDDRAGYEARVRALVPGIDPVSLDAFMNVPRDTLCLVMAFSEGGSPEYARAVALIRGEHPDLMRLACIHEELAQGLGLANDSPRARPSIFNDDEEFALLTTHDELLLKMLYDDRLQTGMTAAEAAPVARIIATELLGGPV